jgi:hypothetical protein
MSINETEHRAKSSAMQEQHSGSLVSQTSRVISAARVKQERTIPMRSKLLIGTAALLAGVALASAQNMPGGGREAPAQSQGAQGAQGGAAGDRQSPSPQSRPTQRGQDKQVQDKQGQAQQGSQGQRGQKDQTTGQAPQGQSDQPKDQKAQGRDSQKDKAQTQQRGPRDRDQTTGQSPRDQSQSPAQTQRDQSPTQQGQPPQRQQGQQGQPSQGQAQQGRSGASVTLTTEQRTKIRETVLVGGNAPRVSKVDFPLNVGTEVPTSVRVVEVAPTLIEIHPEWRGHLYFVVGDEIIIVDRNHRIIAVIEV